jgi:hypothetical protein
MNALPCPKCSKSQMTTEEWNEFAGACSSISAGNGNHADRAVYMALRDHCLCEVKAYTEEQAARDLDARDCEGINAQAGAAPSDRDYFNYGRGR